MIHVNTTVTSLTFIVMLRLCRYCQSHALCLVVGSSTSQPSALNLHFIFSCYSYFSSSSPSTDSVNTASQAASWFDSRSTERAGTHSCCLFSRGSLSTRTYQWTLGSWSRASLILSLLRSLDLLLLPMCFN